MGGVGSVGSNFSLISHTSLVLLSPMSYPSLEFIYAEGLFYAPMAICSNQEIYFL